MFVRLKDWCRIATRCDRCPDLFLSACVPAATVLYRRLSLIERSVGWLKACRSVATCHEKLAVNFAAMVSLAVLRQNLRVLCL
jgi:hypothetical protein